MKAFGEFNINMLFFRIWWWRFFIPSKLWDFYHWGNIGYIGNFSTSTEPYAHNSFTFRLDLIIVYFKFCPLVFWVQGNLLISWCRRRVKMLQGGFLCIHLEKWVECQPWKSPLSVQMVQMECMGRCVTPLECHEHPNRFF